MRARLVRFGSIGLGVAVLVVLVLVGRMRLQETAARGAVQETRVEIPVSVRVAEVVTGTLDEWIHGTGIARATKREYLTFRASGRVARITSRSGRELRLGDRVSGVSAQRPQGELLAELDTTDQVAALAVARTDVEKARQQVKLSEASLAQAEAQRVLDSRNFAREERLLAESATSRESYEQAEVQLAQSHAAEAVEQSRVATAVAEVQAAEARIATAENDLEKTRIYSPIDGVLAYKNLESGWQFREGGTATDSESSALNSVPFVVIDDAEFEISLDVPAYEATRVARGQPVTLRRARDVESASLGNEVPAVHVLGVVDSIAPVIDPGTRSVRIRVRTTAGAEHLRDGDRIACRITVSSDTALILPADATVVSDRAWFAYVVEGDRVARRALTVGGTSQGVFAVLSGVAEGEQVVTAGRFGLYDKALVEVSTGGAGE